MEAIFKSFANLVAKRQSVHSSAGNEVPLADKNEQRNIDLMHVFYVSTVLIHAKEKADTGLLIVRK